MITETVQKEIDYNSGELVEVYSACPDVGRDLFFGDVVAFKLMDGSTVFDINLARQTAAAPDEKTATRFLYELQLLCKKHGILFEEE
tara:strand:- start:70 stop:330 length:261 start_codon:yes stop_codon:yes gene_type:complete